MLCYNKVSMNKNFKQQEDLIDFLQRFEVKKEECCLVGSFSLQVLDLKSAGDIDVSISSSTRERIKSEMSIGIDKKIQHKNKYPVHAVVEGGGFLAFLNDVGISEEELIRNENLHLIYQGYKVMRPELNYAEKLYRCTKLAHVRPKDFRSIKLMERHLKTGAHPEYTWDDNLVLFPKNFKDKLRMGVYHPLFKIVFRIRVIEKNWSYISKFFWCLEYKGLKNTIKMTRDWYGKKNSK